MKKDIKLVFEDSRIIETNRGITVREILKIIDEMNIQSILTTTDLKNINKKMLENVSIFEVKNGNVEKKVG